MPRPSLKADRSKEILDAFERCIVREGIALTSLEQIAQEANMKRSILRHYIGNRDQLIIALGERWNEQYQNDWQFINHLATDNRLQKIIDILFSDEDHTKSVSVLIGEALFAEAKRLPQIKLLMTQWMDEFIAIIHSELNYKFPDVSLSNKHSVAHGILAIYLMAESLRPMSLTDYVIPLKQSAQQLIASLETK